jgi:hypothetical protein
LFVLVGADHAARLTLSPICRCVSSSAFFG